MMMWVKIKDERLEGWMINMLFFTAMPFSVVSMAITQALVARGNTKHYTEESTKYL